MLALKNVLAENDQVTTMVFDEVDTGVSGRAAQKVAEKLSEVARNRQVLCVTHLPQIAAMGDVHFSVEKGEAQGRTFTAVEQLDRDHRRRGAGPTDQRSAHHRYRSGWGGGDALGRRAMEKRECPALKKRIFSSQLAEAIAQPGWVGAGPAGISYRQMAVDESELRGQRLCSLEKLARNLSRYGRFPVSG